MNRSRTPLWKKLLIGLNILLLIGLGGSAVYMYMDNQDLRDELALTDEERTQKSNQDLLDKVSALINLPEGEPIIILVQDAEIAKQENPGIGEIFTDLQKGDYLLIYRKERSGIQYRPSENRIVASKTVAFPVTIELYGSAAAIEQAQNDLEEFGNQISITPKTDAEQTESFVYDIDGDQSEEATAIAEKLGIEVSSTLPTGFTPAEDTEMIVVIAGQSGEHTNLTDTQE